MRPPAAAADRPVRPVIMGARTAHALAAGSYSWTWGVPKLPPRTKIFPPKEAAAPASTPAGIAAFTLHASADGSYATLSLEGPSPPSE